MSISKLHQHARNLAATGWPVFPCISDAAGRGLPSGEQKRPACAGGFHAATTDIAQIDAWWSEDPSYNIATPIDRMGLCVLDLDGAEGEAAFEALAKEIDFKPTYEVRTPRGGRHLYYEGELPMTAWRPGVKRALGEHIDTRGVGSYVLVPPSSINGVPYTVIADREFAPIDPAVQARLAPRDNAAHASVQQLDLLGNRERGRILLDDLVRRGDVAVQGRGGDNRTYQLACELHNLGLSGATIAELMLEHWNPHCIPPWDATELRGKIENASQYAQNEAGSWAVAPAAEVFGSVLDKLSLEDTEPARRSAFYAEDDDEQNDAPDPVWIIPQLIPDASTILIIGAKGSFKSFVAQEILLALAANVGTFGTQPVRSGPTFYGAHEGRNAIKKPRKRAWKVTHEIEGKLPFFVMRAPQVNSVGQCNEFREQIRVRLREPGAQKIAGIVLDTVAKCMVGLNENDARDCGIFSAFCDSLRDEFECPVIALHHFGKDEARGGRGSSALPANFDTVITCKRHAKTLALEVSVQYHKDADEPDDPWTFEGRPIGGSLVFFPTTAQAHREATSAPEQFRGTDVGAALRDLRAVGLAQGVTTTVIATALTQPLKDETPEARQISIERTSKSLIALAKTKLEPYAHRQGRDLIWCLPGGPEPTSEPDF